MTLPEPGREATPTHNAIISNTEANVRTYRHNEVTVHMTKEARTRFPLQQIHSLVKRLLERPDKLTNIDPETDQFARIRAVVRLGIVDGQPIAVKYSGPDAHRQNRWREDWEKEFFVMRRLQQQYQALPTKLPVRPAEVYGYLRLPNSGPNGFTEYLFLEEVPGAEQATSVHRQTGDFQGIPISTEGFSPAHDPQLCTFVTETLSLDPTTDFVSLAQLEKALEVKGLAGFTDLKGGNILKHQTPAGQTEYVIIDQKALALPAT